MTYDVRFKPKILRAIEKLPYPVQKRFAALLRDLRAGGPWQPGWPNYSKLGPGRYHCHLNYDHVACWSYEKSKIIIEVYYVGSRQSAPY